MVTNASLAETGVRMEAYCIGGAEGMSQRSGPYQAKYVIYLLMVSVSQKLTTLVVTTEDACKRGVIKRMFYDTFDQQITIKHGVVLENWPNAKFHSLSNMTFLEAEICLASFENNTTRFRSLPDREWATWKQQYLDTAPDTDQATPTPRLRHAMKRPALTLSKSLAPLPAESLYRPQAPSTPLHSSSLLPQALSPPQLAAAAVGM